MELGKNKTSKREILDPDNPTPEMFYHCQTYYKKVLNPIVDWTTDEVWEFIKEYKVRYCCLYDEGFERLGCIGCPMATVAERKREFERYPKYKENYIKREDAIQEAKAWSMFGKDDLVSRLERLPSADVMPVRHGCWIEQQPKYNLYKCSACEKVCFAELLGDQVVLYDYCPNCGARMDGGNNE